MGPPGRPEPSVQVMSWGRRGEDTGGQTDRQACTSGGKLGVGACPAGRATARPAPCLPRCPPSRAPTCPGPRTPGRTDVRASVWWGRLPRVQSVGGLCGAQVFPQIPQTFLQSSLKGEPPRTPPYPRLCPEPEETVTSVPVPFTKGTGWRDTPLPRPQAEGGLRGICSFPSSSKRVVGPGEVAGLVGRLRVCLRQGGEAPWSRGCWTPRAQEGRPGAGRTCAEGADEPPLTAQAHPWGTMGSRLPSRAPFPAPGRQEAQASRRPEPGSAICFPVFTQPRR